MGRITRNQHAKFYRPVTDVWYIDPMDLVYQFYMEFKKQIHYYSSVKKTFRDGSPASEVFKNLAGAAVSATLVVIWIVIGSTSDCEFYVDFGASHGAIHAGMRSRAPKAMTPSHKLDMTVTDVANLFRVFRDEDGNISYERVVAFRHRGVESEQQGRDFIQDLMRFSGDLANPLRNARSYESCTADYVSFANFKVDCGGSVITAATAHLEAPIASMMVAISSGDTVFIYDNFSGTRTMRDYVLAVYYSDFLNNCFDVNYEPTGLHSNDPYNEYQEYTFVQMAHFLRARSTKVRTGETLLRLFPDQNFVAFPNPINPLTIIEVGLSKTKITLADAAEREAIRDASVKAEMAKLQSQYDASRNREDQDIGKSDSRGKPSTNPHPDNSRDDNASSTGATVATQSAQSHKDN